MVGFTCGDDQASVHHALQVEWSSPWSFSVDSQGEHTVHWQVCLGRTGSFRGFLDPAAWPLFRWQFLSGALWRNPPHVRDFAWRWQQRALHGLRV